MKLSNKISDKGSSNKKLKLAFIVNLGLIISGLAMSLSGFVIQFKYHMGHNPVLESENSVLETGYINWTNIHKISIIVISILATFHFILHWRWYRTVIIKKLGDRNKLQIILLIVFIIVAITGYIPWIVDLTGGSEIVRKSFIEIHDKITILLFVLLVIHVTKRLKWYTASLDKLINKQNK